MNNFIKSYFMPFMALFIIFLGEISICTQIVTDMLGVKVVKHAWSIVIAGVAYFSLAFDAINGKIKRKEFQVLYVLIILFVLYAMTSLFYPPNSKHFSYLLLFIVESIPTAYLGVRFAKSKTKNKINDLLPYFIILSSLLIGTIGMRYAAIGEQMGHDESGLNYQTLSYYMAFSFSYSSYYAFFMKKATGMLGKTIRGLMMLVMLFSGLVCLASGGRGAFVFILAISIYLAYIYIKTSNKHRIRAVLIVVLIIIVVVWLISRFNVMESAGMLRVLSRLTEDEERMMLYAKAYDAFINSPLIGNGVGSVWWTVGFYSHNMLLDFLSETGILGTSIVLVILSKSLLKNLNYAKIDRIYVFFLIVMLGALVRNMFSSYWVSAIKLFFICSMFYCLPSQKIKKNN